MATQLGGLNSGRLGNPAATSFRYDPGVIYRLDFSDEALAQLRALPGEQRRRIGQRLDALQHDLQGDVKKLVVGKCFR